MLTSLFFLCCGEEKQIDLLLLMVLVSSSLIFSTFLQMTALCELFCFVQKVWLRALAGCEKGQWSEMSSHLNVWNKHFRSLARTLTTILKSGLFSLFHNPTLHLASPPPVPLKYPSLPSSVEGEYRADDGFISSVSLCTKRPRSLSSQPVFGLKAARKGLPVTDPLC